MKHLPILNTLVLLLFIACNNESGQTTSPQVEPSENPVESSEQTGDLPYDPATMTIDSTVQNNSVEDPANLLVDTDPLEGVDPNASPVTTVNPEHGKTGHRCDIRVGEPMTPEVGDINYCDKKSE